MVFLSPAAQWGGAETVLLDWVRSLRDAAPAMSLRLLAGEQGPVLEACKAINVPCDVLPFPNALHTFGSGCELSQPNSLWLTLTGPARRLRAWACAGLAFLRYQGVLRRRLRQLQPDVIHSNGAKMHLLGALTKPRTTLIVWHLHDYLERHRVMRTLLRSVASRCSVMIAVSRSVASDAHIAVPQHNPVVVIHNAVDTGVFTPDGPALDLAKLSGLSPPVAGVIRVGLVATFAHWKGHDVFLQAAASLLGGNSIDYRFYVIGGPIYATGGSQWTLGDLRARAGALGIADCVGFTGFLEDVPAAMRGLDVVVHASTLPEPFGLVILQAMACGRPVIVSAIGGACELITPEENALAVSPGDSLALAQAIGRLAGDPVLRQRLGRAGRANVECHFSRAGMATKVTDFYQDLQARCH